MVAAAMTLLMPGAGPPPTRMAMRLCSFIPRPDSPRARPLILAAARLTRQDGAPSLGAAFRATAGVDGGHGASGAVVPEHTWRRMRFVGELAALGTAVC